MHPSFVDHIQIKPNREKLLHTSFFNPFSLAFQNKSILDIEHLHFLQVFLCSMARRVHMSTRNVFKRFMYFNPITEGKS